jgi:nucleoside-diphosphate-sugar epimerase
MRVLVTGNKGYIGSILVQLLLAKGHNVTGLDTGFYDDCSFYRSTAKIKQITKDIRDITKDDLKDIDAIIHLAALSNDPLSDFDSKLTFAINYKAAVKLAKLAKKQKISRFVFASSQSVYGKVKGSKYVTEKTIPHPLTAYGKSKLLAEKEILALNDNNFCTVSLRPSTVYGISPRLRTDIVLNNLVGWAFTTNEIRLMSDGTPWRPVIHIEDIGNAFMAALIAPEELVKGQIFNVGEKESYRIKDMAEMIKKIIGKCQISYAKNASKDERSYRVNSDKFRKALKDYYIEKWEIKKGIADLYSNYKRYHLTSQQFGKDKYARLAHLKKLILNKKINKRLYWVKR